MATTTLIQSKSKTALVLAPSDCYADDMTSLIPDMTELAREIEESIQQDDGRAAKEHLDAGRSIYYGDPGYPGQIIKEFPDGRRQLVEIDRRNVVTVIKEI